MIASPLAEHETLAPPPPDLRRRVVAWVFGRLIHAAERQLCAPGALPMRGIHRIVVCRPNHRLGNAMLISPLIAEIEALYPGAEIDIVAAGHASEALYASRFNVRRVVSLPRRVARHLGGTIGLLRQLRACKYDLAIDACLGSQSGRLLLAWIRASHKVGFPAASWGMLDTPSTLVPNRPDHLAQRAVFLLRRAYAGRCESAYPPLDIRLGEAEQAQGREALDAIVGAPSSRPGRVVIGVFPNATGAKRYDGPWWQTFLASLQAARPDILVVDVLAEHGVSQLGDGFASFYSRDVRKLAAVIAGMDGFISADCGVMHVAAATGTPTYGLFSVTDPAKYAPYGHGSAAIDTRGLSAEESARAVLRLLAGTRRAAM